jgi:hypothetical protein
MKAWTDLNLISKPSRIARMAVDERGYPIPYFALVKDGVPNLLVVDRDKWARCIIEKRCWVCGEKLDTLIAFVGGPMCMKHRVFSDAGMHRDCAEYAMQVCPMLAAPKYGYAQTPAIDGVDMNTQDVSMERPDKHGVGITASFDVIRNGGGYSIKAGPWLSLQFWRNGKVIEEHVR